MLLSLAGPVAAALTASLCLRRASMKSAVLTALAMPCIAMRRSVRAEMFSVILTAAFLKMLWTYHSTGRGRLWWLPGLMVLWVNLHPIFSSALRSSAPTSSPRRLIFHSRTGELEHLWSGWHLGCDRRD